jgi:hypothetical protein
MFLRRGVGGGAVRQNAQNSRQQAHEQHDQKSFHNPFPRVSSTQHLDDRPSPASSALPPIIDALLPVISSGSGLQV